MPRYNNKGKLNKSTIADKSKMQNPETGKFGVKVQIPVYEHVNLYHDCIKIAVYKVAEGETNFKDLPDSAKAYLGSVFIMWKKSFFS